MNLIKPVVSIFPYFISMGWDYLVQGSHPPHFYKDLSRKIQRSTLLPQAIQRLWTLIYHHP